MVSSVWCRRCEAPVDPAAFRCGECGLNFPGVPEGDVSGAEFTPRVALDEPGPAPLMATGVVGAADPAPAAPAPAPAAPVAPTPAPAAPAPAPAAPSRAGDDPTRLARRRVLLLAVGLVGALVIWLAWPRPDKRPELALAEPRLERIGDRIDVILDVEADPEVSVLADLVQTASGTARLDDGTEVDLAGGSVRVDSVRGGGRLRFEDAPPGPFTLEITAVSDGGTSVEQVDLDVPPAVDGWESYQRWIAVLISSDGPVDPAGSGVDGAALLRSDDWPSLRPGYWVAYRGPLDSGEAVRELCAELGRSSQRCYGRVLSLDPADRDTIAR